MSSMNVRVVIPRDVDGLLQLASAISAQHATLGDRSPLKAMEDFNWTEMAPKVARALALHQEAQALQKKAEELNAERNLLLPGIKGAVASSRDLLKGVYAKNPKKMGDFGLTVDHTPREKRTV